MKFEKPSADWLDLNVIFAKFAIISGAIKTTSL